LNASESSSSSPPARPVERRESSLSTQSIPTQRSRPVSEEPVNFSPPAEKSVAFPPSTPTPTSHRVSQASPKPRPILQSPSPGPSYISTQKASSDAAPVAEFTVSTSAIPSSPQISIESDLLTQASIISHPPPQPDQEKGQFTNMVTSTPPPAVKSNGSNVTNGVLSPPMSPQAQFRSKGRLPSFSSSRAPSHNFSMKMSKRANGGGSYKIGFVQENALALRKRSMAELGAGKFQSVSNVSYVSFLEWIRAERLTTLPHKVCHSSVLALQTCR
jgi:hypothetical protein